METTKTTTTTTTEIKKQTKKNTITLQTAKKWAKKWRNLESSYNKYHKLKVFNIPKIDLQKVLAEDGVVDVRAYIGVETFTDSDTGEKITEEKLMIVGVDKNNRDMIATIKGLDGELISDPEGKGDIYDFTKPCPTHCPKDRPLAD